MEQAMAPLRMAVVGVGHLGKEHARILTGLPDVELVGVADIINEQAENVARRLGCRCFHGYRPLLHLADAVIVAVPTTLHRAIAGEFLGCGISVLVEKPLAANLHEAEELVELAERHGALLQVGHIERFNPAFEELAGRTFQPKFIRCERIGPFSGRSTDIGVVLDLMIHDLDLVLNLVRSPVEAVEALGVSVFGGHEDVANARVRFAGGSVADLSASRASFVTRRQMHIWAPEGFVGIDFAAHRLTFVQPSDAMREHGLDPSRLAPASRAMLKDELFGRHLETYEQQCHTSADQLTAELKHFVRCLQGGTHPRVSGVEGRDAVALAGQILDCIAQHRWEGHAGGPTGPNSLPRPLGRFFHPYAGEAAA
jgi:predicted dehydrogenase